MTRRELSDGADELILYLDNEEPLWRQKQAIHQNLARKKDRRTYDKTKAPKAFAPLLMRAAKTYQKEFKTPGMRERNNPFPATVRQEAARELTDRFDSWFKFDRPAPRTLAKRTSKRSARRA
jgi:hypothetical protein